MVALRQLSAIFLTAASAFVIAMALQQHPVLKRDVVATATFVRVHGTEAAVALNDYVIQPGWKFTRRESVALGQKIAEEFSSAPQQVTQPAPIRLAAIPKPKPRPDIHFAKQIPPTETRVAKIVAPVAPAQTQLAQTAPEKRSAPQIALATPPVVTAPQTDNSQAPLRPSVTETPKQSDQQVASASPVQPKMMLAPQATAPAPPSNITPETASPVPNIPPPSPAELVPIAQRLKDSLTSEMMQNFSLFLYVSKAETGPWAQRMYVFQKESSGNLELLYNWPVSTGREKIELAPNGAQEPSFTPAGYYELDAKRFYPHYRSMQWNQPMPYAMFFNWVKDGNPTGLAIHAASGDDIGLLGSRASAGCVRLAPESARLLFNLIKTQYKGLAPRFAMDKRTGTMSNDGILLHDKDGHVQLAEGYKVLVFIENYGGENVVAALF